MATKIKNSGDLPSGLSFEYVDSNLDMIADKCIIYGAIYKTIEKMNLEKDINVIFEVRWDSANIEFNWESDGAATYVPYGEQSVLYDDGKGGLDSVDVSGIADIYSYDYKYNDKIITEEQAIELLGCSQEDFNEAVTELCKIVPLITENLIEDYYDDPWNWPEREDDEPDYDDWRDLDWE